MQVIVNNLPVNYAIAGQGKAILLVHGWGDTLETWRKLQASLSKKYKVIALDLPGFGGSAAPDIPWDLMNYATFLRDFLDKISVEDIYAIIGHSNGGAIATYGLGERILDTQKLVLLASSGVRPRQTVKKQSLGLLAKTGKVIAKVLPKRQQVVLQRKLYSSIGSDALIVPHMRKTFEMIVGQDIQVEASHVTIPTLLLYGDRDKATPVRYAETLQRRIRNSRLVIIPGVGHFLHHEASRAIEEEIKGFLNV